MNAVPEFDLEAYSHALTELVKHAGQNVVAVQAAAYRVSSGVVFREDLVATNSHVLRREGKIPIDLPDGTQAHGAILGRDPAVDVAILQIAGGKLQAGIPEESSQLRAGALAVVVGRTLDAGLSASAGILGAAGGPRRTWRGGSLTQFLRLDVNLYPSQAGAAVVGATGRLIGMATGAMSRHSALAIPFETLNRVADELLKSGHIRQGYLGVSLQPVPIPAHLRSRASLASETGLMILSVEPDTGAEKAGLQLGDIVIAAGGESIGDTESLQALLRGDAVGAPIKLTLFHAGEVIEREVRVSDRGPGRRH